MRQHTLTSASASASASISTSTSTSTSGHHDHPPPPYTLVPPTGSKALSAPAPAPAPASSLFYAQLSGLQSQIRQQQAARSSAQDRHDDLTLSLLVPHIEALLDSIAAISPSPSLVEATLIPDDAVDKSWRLSDPEGNKNGRFTKLVRVGEGNITMEGNEKHWPAPLETLDLTAPAKESNEWRWEKDKSSCEQKQNDSEAHLSWWSDEELARRLATHLQPTRETAFSESCRQTHDATVERSSREAKKTGRRWSLFKKDTRLSASKDSKPIHPSINDTTQPSALADSISMEVNAEETTFRRQNEMGIWESRTGWGLVVRVRIRT
ncbi:hypothetical protein E4U21_002360 [Claviceps maximensis]|nr:hypothetical protein E4U21_002360 [Claviceps maximensis]